MSLVISPEPFAATTFDFLIAGGGTAGLVLANRITEIPTISVAVIEAGEVLTNDTRVLIPLYLFDVTGDLKNDWNITSEPQEALEVLCAFQNRGKMLGGSSGINYMQLIFASRAPYYRNSKKSNEHDQSRKLLVSTASSTKMRMDMDAQSVPLSHPVTPPSRPLGQKRWPTWA
ncbi:MAG: hypothetical protein Q9205_004463 [Flavoplaca limonia]